MIKRGSHNQVYADLAQRLNLPKQRIVLVPASLWKRAIAFIIDMLVINLIIFSPFKPLFIGSLEGKTSFDAISAYLESNPAALSQLSWALAIIIALTIAYFTILQFRIRQTLGMMLFDLWVYTDVKDPSLWRIMLSNISLIPSFPFILLWIIDPLYLIFSGVKQRLMQRLTGIYMVEQADAGYTL